MPGRFYGEILRWKKRKTSRRAWERERTRPIRKEWRRLSRDSGSCVFPTLCMSRSSFLPTLRPPVLPSIEDEEREREGGGESGRKSGKRRKTDLACSRWTNWEIRSSRLAPRGRSGTHLLTKVDNFRFILRNILLKWSTSKKLLMIITFWKLYKQFCCKDTKNNNFKSLSRSLYLIKIHLNKTILISIRIQSSIQNSIYIN